MKIGLSGGKGFVGSHLVKWFESKGYETTIISRKALNNSDITELCNEVDQCDIIINLAGAPINKRWSTAYRKELRTSRINTTHNLVKAINRSERVKLLISTSAVGIYPSNECYDESCTKVSDTFLARLCHDWEREAKGVRKGVRLVITRFGVIFAARGGAYEKMLLPFRFGISTTFGSVENKISWIDIHDLVQIFNLIVTRDDIEGVINLTSPRPITQQHFAQTLARHYCTVARINISTKILSLLMGDSHIVLSSNSCIFPSRLKQLGYRFISPDFESYLQNIAD